MSDTSEYRSELRTYLLGLGLAAALSAVPFVMVAAHILNRRGCLWAIGGCGVVQVLVHFRCFLHIDLTRQKRDDLQLILFSTLIVMLMVSGTIWITASQHAHMG